jgi:hypothetical protein
MNLLRIDGYSIESADRPRRRDRLDRLMLARDDECPVPGSALADYLGKSA